MLMKFQNYHQPQDLEAIFNNKELTIRMVDVKGNIMKNSLQTLTAWTVHLLSKISPSNEFKYNSFDISI